MIVSQIGHIVLINGEPQHVKGDGSLRTANVTEDISLMSENEANRRCAELNKSAFQGAEYVQATLILVYND